MKRPHSFDWGVDVCGALCGDVCSVTCLCIRNAHNMNNQRKSLGGNGVFQVGLLCQLYRHMPLANKVMRTPGPSNSCPNEFFFIISFHSVLCRSRSAIGPAPEAVYGNSQGWNTRTC